MDTPPLPKARRPLRDVICDIDKDILRLLMRRANLLRRMRGDKAFLDASEEGFLRSSWRKAATSVSSDARLSVRFFSLMQEVEFLPKPEDLTDDDKTRMSQFRAGFNLAPAQKPVRLEMRPPLLCRATRALLMLAAATGKPLSLAPCLMNKPILDCIRMLNQAGANLTREDGCVTARESTPLAAPDKPLHTGDSPWNFYLMLAHYLWHPSRVRLSGDSTLKLADLSAVRRFLPELGARLAHVIPQSNGLPARLECSGDVPVAVNLPGDVPPEFGEAMLLAAHGLQKGFTLNIAEHPHRELIRSRVIPLLKMTGSLVDAENGRIGVRPAEMRLPQKIALPMEPELALFLLALPLALGGEVRLDGFWPAWPQALAGLALLEQLGLETRKSEDGIRTRAERIATVHLMELPPDFSAEWLPLPWALAACAALRGGEAVVPALFANNGDNGITQETCGFLQAVGLAADEDGKLYKEEQNLTPWNAPDPVWALAFALAACARPHLKLGNPDIVADLYPGFWNLYNTLPDPAAQRATPSVPAPQASESEQKTPRRRIISAIPAVVPKVKPAEEDASAENRTESGAEK